MLRPIKRKLLFSLLFLLSLSPLCCSQEKGEETTILARVNDWDLTLGAFEGQLADECELNKDFKVTNEVKKEFLEELIRKELLIQEAKRLKLDTKEKFVRSIERYWESTLIRDLIDLKCKELNERVYVSQEEIETTYKEMKKSDASLPPLDETRERIVEELKTKKETKMLEQWVDDLRKNARIVISEDLL